MSRTILVVDDEPNARSLLRLILVSAGFEVLVEGVGAGEEGDANGGGGWLGVLAGVIATAGEGEDGDQQDEDKALYHLGLPVKAWYLAPGTLASAGNSLNWW